MGIKEVYPEASKLKRQKSTKVYGSKSGSQNGFDFHGSDEEIEHGSKERTNLFVMSGSFQQQCLERPIGSEAGGGLDEGQKQKC
jgi:hypothetical protein